MVSLTDQERDKFEIWLRQEAKTNEGLIDQMKNLPSMPGALIERYKQISVACLVVAGILRHTESTKLSG
ncbi:MAG: hypothetical protein OXJ55_08000 [Caldilineaceae bacterium]|nr:hypothetical protein [Caldilineaceae bacterium]